MTLKRLLPIWLAVLLIIPALAFSAGAEDDKAEYRKKLIAGEIFTEADYAKDGRGVEASAKALIFAPPDVVWSVFIDSNRWKTFKIPTWNDSRVLTREFTNWTLHWGVKDSSRFYDLLGDSYFSPDVNRKRRRKWIAHSFHFFDFPWPISNRWVILRAENDETRWRKKFYKMTWTHVAGNVKLVIGSCTFEAFEGNPKITYMDYRMHADSGTNIPRFLLKWGARKAMPRAVEGLRKGVANEILLQSVLKNIPTF